jgi:hypothetical protein
VRKNRLYGEIKIAALGKEKRGARVNCPNAVCPIFVERSSKIGCARQARRRGARQPPPQNRNILVKALKKSALLCYTGHALKHA